MSNQPAIRLFNDARIRVHWDAEAEKWYFAISDVIAVLTESINPVAYWRKLKERLKKEGNETVTNCHALKMPAPDGKMRLTDVADTEQLLRLIQSIPSPNAEPLTGAQYAGRSYARRKGKGFTKADLRCTNEIKNDGWLKSMRADPFRGQGARRRTEERDLRM